MAPLPDTKLASHSPDGKSGKLVSLGNSGRYLCDGQREINYEPFLQAASLFSMDRHVHGVNDAPFGAGPAYRNRGMLETFQRMPGKYTLSWLGLREVDGRPMIGIRFDETKAFQLKGASVVAATTWFFDPAHGHLPAHLTALWNDKPKSDRITTAFREVSNQRWFPENIVTVDYPDKADGLFDVRVTKVLELDADKRPKDEEFVITLPPGTSVLEYGEPEKGFFKVRQEERIGLAEIPKLFKMLENKNANPLADTAVPRRDPMKWYGIIAGTGLLGLGVLALAWRRRQVRF